MPKRLFIFASSLCLFANAHGDASSSIEPIEIASTQDPFFIQIAAPTAVERPFSPFTGKVKRPKVRLPVRLSANLERQFGNPISSQYCWRRRI